MKNPLKTFAANQTGRDFVIGDMHGSYSAFLNLKNGLQFDETIDRMFSVGDLCDRGPQSLKCLQLLNESWFHAVLSNHEEMMVHKFNGGPMGAWWYQNGGNWAMQAFNEYNAVYNLQTPGRMLTDSGLEVIDMLPVVEELPYLITVDTKSGKKFHILHAELPTNIPIITDEMLSDPETVRKIAETKQSDGSAFLWMRNTFEPFYSTNLSNRDKLLDMTYSYMLAAFNDKLSHIISGHTIVQKPLTIGGQTDIDTGAFLSYGVPPEPYSHAGRPAAPWAGLTCVELDTWKFYKATENAFTETQEVVIRKDDLKD